VHGPWPGTPSGCSRKIQNAGSSPPAQLGIVTFTRTGWSREDHAARVAAVAAGDAIVTSTVLQRRPALRLCTINPRTTEADLALTLQRLAGA
jgi:aromatic-L-amino-acid/L-tryptophan decarboxylase